VTEFNNEENIVM